MRVVAISDTHLHEPEVPEGDMLIHAGDATLDGTIEETAKFAMWFTGLPHRIKVFVPGNHDHLFQKFPALAEQMLKGCIVLSDRAQHVENLLLYGTPWTPRFMNWAFMEDEKRLERIFDWIPNRDLDILITHTPPYMTLDGFPVDEHTTQRIGSKARADRVMRVKPRFHIFGHCHPGYGTLNNGRTTFINASICDLSYQPVNAPHIFEV